jgi:hypothetical protein
MRIVVLGVVAVLMASCNLQAEVKKQDDFQSTEQSIIHEEYTGIEPTKPEDTEKYEPVPPTVAPYGQDGVPSDAIVLFKGSDFDEWMMLYDSTAVSWHLNDDASMTVKDKAGDIRTKRNFGDVQLHLEWRSPADISGEGQSRANSGVFLQGLYEVQVLDNNNNDTYVNGQIASIYKQHVPLAKASVPSGQWNTYDMVYHAPKFNDNGDKIKSADITVIHNGVLVQDHVEIKGTTPYEGWPKNPPHGKGPLRLQDHGDNSRVSYRNIWIREL